MKKNRSSSNSTKKTTHAKESITHATLSGLSWTFSGTGAQAIFRIGVLAVLAHLLTPEDFGVVGAATIVVGVSQLFSQLGIGAAIIQRSNLEITHIRTGFTLSLIFGIFLTAVIVLSAPVIAQFFDMKALTPVLQVMSFTFALKSLSVVAESLLLREFKFRTLAGIQITSYALGFGLVSVVLAWLGFGVWALVWGQLAQRVLETISLLLICRHPKRPSINIGAFKDLMSFGSGMTMAKIADYCAQQGDNLIVARLLGAEALGLYSRAYQLMVTPTTLLGQATDRVMFSTMSRVQDDPKRLNLGYQRQLALTNLLIFPLSAIMVILAPEIIMVLLGPKWIAAVIPFQIFAIGTIFRMNYRISFSLVRSKGAVYNLALRQSIYAVLVVIAAWFGQHWGINGVALAVLGALAINFLLVAQLCFNIVSMSWKDYYLAHLPAALLTVIAYAEGWFVATLLRDLNQSPIVIIIASAVVVGTTFLVLFRLIPTLVLGRDGLWILNTLIAYLPEKFDLFSWKKKVQRIKYVA